MTAYLCNTLRSPIGRYGGSLASLRPDDLAAQVMRGLLERHPNIDPAGIDEVILGCANQAGEDNRNVARMASLIAGLPETVPGYTVNRLCGSGFEAVVQAARMIKTNEADLVLAGGVESMTRAPLVMPKANTAFSRNTEMYDTTIGWRFVNPALSKQYGTESMPETAENVAAEYGVSREDQDAYALRSQERTQAAIKAGRLAEEIVPVEVPVKRGEVQSVSVDEHPRADTTAERLARLPTPFRDPGTVTAGNAAGINDGCALLLVASEAAVKQYGLTPIARIETATSSGVAPRLMGMGPVPAVHSLVERTGQALERYDVIEINEAFAAQVLAVARELGLDDDDPRLNPNGGAIALGHPLGATGARIIGTAALEMSRRGGRSALASLCVGVGQGLAVHLAAV
ncbi:acetyl-CoA acetyltransferase [Saccharospirillum salsuginis]|uniref:Beta-ketoadipyl-CoA thiolase n=2 Tax=Saccharospirillum salsuginis TaxID=418750 RepID=A0A918KN16_9GAMM|nr:acetyl-CoA acetyltransferase [Saccharospirillum salsuginis]